MAIKVARLWLPLLIFGLGIVTTFLILHFTFLSSADSEDADLEEYATIPKSLEKEHWTNLEDSLESGYDIIQNYPTLEEATLILGETGSDNTNLIRILTGGVGIPLVVDKAERRVAAGAESFIPQLLQSNSSFFYNCPGFYNIPGSDPNVATNFFLSQIVKRVSRLKILFLATHNSLKTTTGLDLLAEHATNFIRNVPKYKNSIGLVVVTNKSYSSKNSELNEIVRLLSNFRNNLRSNLVSDGGRAVNTRKIQFVEGLSQKDGKGQYGHLSIVPSSHLNEFDGSKEMIATLNLEATPVHPGDLGYTLKRSENTTNSIQHVVGKSNFEISKSVEQLLLYFPSWYNAIHSELKTEVETFLQKIRVDYDQLASLTNPDLLGNISDPLKFALSLKTSLGKVGYRTRHHFLLFMERQEAYFNFFQQARVSPLPRDVEAWTEPIKKVESSLASLRDWYGFIQNLQLVLHSYNFQLNKSTFPPRGEEVPWLDYIERNNMFPVSSRVRDVAQEISAGELNMLNSVMTFALSPLEHECSGETLTLSGNFILLSELIVITNNGTSDFRWTCKVGITKVEIYASHTLFIDSALSMVGREMNIVMIAPAWDVISEAELDLSGSPGSNYPSNASVGISPAKGRGGAGADGLSGKPGGPGGSLFGIVEAIRNGSQLKITFTGGNGGDGQSGGQGGVGANGKDDPDYDGKGGSGWPGGNGGNGGIGGLGGNGGQATIISLVSGAEFLKIVEGAGEMGNYGLGGEGGTGGMGGRVGGFENCRYRKSDDLIYGTGCYYTRYKDPADDGLRGVDNVGTGGQENPKPTKYSIVEWKSIVNFKYTFFPISHPQIISFRKLLEGREQIEEYYTVKAYAEELLQLEKMSMRGDDADTEDLHSTYKSCIHRMEAYIERKKEQVTLSEKKVLALSLALAYSKLANMEQSRLGQDLGIVVDVSQYFSYLKEKLAQLRSASASLTISEENVAHGENIMVKVGQVQEFISGVVTPALSTAQEEIRFRLRSLVAQMEKMLGEAEENLEEMKRLLEKEKANLWLNAILGVFQMTTQVLGGLDPSGTLKMVGAGVSLAQGVLQERRSGGSGLGAALGHVRSMHASASEAYAFMSTSPDKSSTGEQEGEGDDPNQTSTKSLQKREEALLTLGDGVASLYDKYKNDNARISQLEAAVQEAEMIVKDVSERKEAMEKTFIPVVHSMMAYFKNLESHLEGGSSGREESLPAGELDITKWQVSGALKRLKADLEGLSSGITTTEFLRAIDSLQDALTMMLDLYKNIEKYQTEKNLADYLTKVSTASLSSVQISDSELATSISRLDKLTRENLLKREYLRGMHALRQWVFPFAKLHLTQFQSDLDVAADDNDDLLDVYLAQIETLDSQLKKYKATTLIAQDTYIIKTEFSSEHLSSRPFYVWKNDEFRSEIGRLLAGEEVHLYADLRQSLEGRDAVKFSQIEINFKLAEGEESSSELGEELEHFSVSMTHSGISPYRFQGEIYVMSGTNQTIRYNFERDSKGNRLGTNLIYRKFEEGDFLLSPYTLWTFQLRKALSSDETVNFDKLHKFVDLVDLELVGTGVYVDASSKLNVDLEMRKYYVSEESFWSE